MDWLLILLRLAHVVLGGVWVGMVIFTVVFLTPAVQDTGPDGGKVMGALQRRGIMTVMPTLALVTILSGLWLYWRVSDGFHPLYMGSGVGMAFGTGGAAAIIAYVIGITVMRPAMLQAAALAQSMSSAPEGERPALSARIQQLRRRGAGAGKVVAVLLVFALGAMAIARYL